MPENITDCYSVKCPVAQKLGSFHFADAVTTDVGVEVGGVAVLDHLCDTVEFVVE